MINLSMALLLIAFSCLVLCLRLTPHAMLELAAWLRATAEADRERLAARARYLRMYREEMGLTDGRWRPAKERQ